MSVVQPAPAPPPARNGGAAPSAPGPLWSAVGTAPAVAPMTEWSAESPDGMVRTNSLRSVCRGANAQLGMLAYARMKPIPTGFEALDLWIGGGLRQGELVLLGGSHGVGKTTFCLQMARNVAAGGTANVLYACYEHPEEYVLNRLLVQETIDTGSPRPLGGLSLLELQNLLIEGQERNPGGGIYDPLRGHPTGGRALQILDSYAERFHLLADAARRTSLEAIDALVAMQRAFDDRPLVLFVDYLQKVTISRHDIPEEAERVTEIVQGLKEIALKHSVAVVAIVAAEKAGLTAPRMRFTHLRGSSALMYEADIAVIMNDKWKVIDRDHIVFNTHKAQQYRDWVVCTIEKNRGGHNLVELEFQKRFDYCCFNPTGARVTERLYEERIHGERS